MTHAEAVEAFERVAEMVYTFGATDGARYFIVYGYDPTTQRLQRILEIAERA
mgnify:CR=1 FL=1